MNYLEKIRKSALFRTIPIELLQGLIRQNLLQITTYGKGQVIHFEGDRCTALELVLDGKVVVERIDESGDLFTITEFYPNDVLGGNLLFSSNPFYPMTISARTDVKVLKVHKDILFDLCSSNKDFLSIFLKLISDNTVLLGDKIKNYTNRSIRESICAYLKQEYQVQKVFEINLGITKKALAERIGVQRTSLSRELQKMKKEGLINHDATTITILDPKIIK